MHKKSQWRWRRNWHALRDVFFSRCWDSYTPSCQGECKCLSETPSANMQFLHCKHLPISQQWSWQYSCHTAEWVKQFLEAENIEIMKWSGQCPDLKINNISEKNQVFIDYSLIWSPLYLRWWSWSWRDVIVLKARSRFIQCYSGIL